MTSILHTLSASAPLRAIPLTESSSDPGHVRQGLALRFMKAYVVGFMFNEGLDHVSVIRKNKPAWQAGKLNGIGGKIEDGESPIEAMVREFREETGMTTQSRDWSYFLRMEGNENGDNGRVDGKFRVDFFCCVGDLNELRSETPERVELHRVLHLMTQFQIVLENIPWVIGLAVDHLRDGRPSFVEAKYP